MPAKFSASVGYQSVNEGTTNYHYYYVETVAKCTVYKLKVIDIQSILLTKSFQNAVRNLPTVANYDSYFAFFVKFGTHFATELIMGAKAVIRSEFQENSWSEMHSRGIDVNLGAGLSFGGGNSGVSSHTTTKETFECLRNSHRQFYLGSRPPEDGDFNSWAQSVGTSPYPVQYTLTALTDLFSINLIPGSLKRDLDIKKALFNDALIFYCSQFLSRTGCNVPTSDRPYNSRLSDSRCKSNGKKLSTSEKLFYGTVVAMVFEKMKLLSVLQFIL